MGRKNKLKRFEENETFSNLIQPKREEIVKNNYFLKGKWKSYFFKNKNPIVLELCCGKGEYTLYLADENPKKNYIGIDIKGSRLWSGAKTALRKNFDNVAFLRIQIELIGFCFAQDEIDEIWITFPDPQIKYRRTKHRITRPEMLLEFKKIIKNDGILHLKTDSKFLFGYTLGIVSQIGEILYAHNDIYKNENAPKKAKAVQTFYEKKFLQQKKSINYMKFRL